MKTMKDTSTEMSAEAYIDAFQEDKRHELLPVIVVMAIICTLGTVGNSFTIAFYGFIARRTPTILLITVLASVDLVVCILIIAQITEISVNVKFTSAAGCKILHFLGHWGIEVSAILLWFIAIDRYRQVCCPFKKQVSYTVAKRAAVGISIASFLQSVRDFINFDIIEFPLEGYASNATVALAHYCTTSEDPKFNVNITFWHSFDAVIALTILVTLFVTYGRIVWVLKTDVRALDKDNRMRCYHEPTTSDDRKYSNVHTIKAAKNYDDRPDVKEHADKPGQCSKRNGPHKTAKIYQSKTKTTERSITLMMMVVSIVFCMCLIPYFVIKIGIRSYRSASQLELGVWTQFAIRLPYVNSFANPFVFCCFNPQFRSYIKLSLFRLKPGSKQSRSTDATELHSTATP